MIMKSNTPPPGTATPVTSEVEAKGGTDRPRNMPIVLIVSILAALVGMGAVWGFVFA
jgi:hypothetical protein